MRGKLQLRVVDQLAQSHIAKKWQEVAFHCLCWTDTSKMQMSEQHYRAFRDQCCSNPSLVRKRDLCVSDKKASEGQGPSPLCIILSAPGTGSGTEQKLGKWRMKTREKGIKRQTPSGCSGAGK